MANDLEDLVLTLSADTRQIKRALDRLDRDVNRSATNIEKRFAGAKRSMDVFAASVSGAGRGLLAGLGVGSRCAGLPEDGSERRQPQGQPEGHHRRFRGSR